MRTEKLGDRMKRYEEISRPFLKNKQPVIIRLDGRAFHTLTRFCDKPHDSGLVEIFALTVEGLLKEVGNVRAAYHQSDEISLLLDDRQKEETEPWFGNNLSKLVSVSASRAAALFIEAVINLNKTEKLKIGNVAFDARAFNLSDDEVVNYFLWRWFDCRRNSVSACARAKFSHKALWDVDQKGMIAMLRDVGFDWDSYDANLKYGTFWHREIEPFVVLDGPFAGQYVERTFWRRRSAFATVEGWHTFFNLTSSPE